MQLLKDFPECSLFKNIQSPEVFQNATFKRFSRMQSLQKYSKSKGFPECNVKNIQSPKNGFPECNRQYKQYFPLNQILSVFQNAIAIH
jgi:hypothetical protein